ncbi:MAG: DUF2284 domain-containing protein [Deltaproteobacteria bacterium]|nr:DUF2284 domain-containing protein [Candidatus Anaeroferrophillus wilburensis]MBN2887990.1 DUF2284 domain-containing protein [Deltaproteobacteria bacterium]
MSDLPLTVLRRLAAHLGASDVALLNAADIVVEDRLAALCREPGCEWYGQSCSCPPHVGGPAVFRKLLEIYPQALAFRIDAPKEVLFSADRREVFHLLHTIAADLEAAAEKEGFSRAAAFAGGSCKDIFCTDQSDCRVLAIGGSCRHPEAARPSLSGFGVNVSHLLQTAEWEDASATGALPDEADNTMPLVGLVLLG